jgi:hypothetical protein
MSVRLRDLLPSRQLALRDQREAGNYGLDLLVLGARWGAISGRDGTT